MWHFTHVANVRQMIRDNHILPAARVDWNRNVANLAIKQRRTSKLVDPDDAYPRSFVSDHVPFYIAAKSPMLYFVCRGYGEYKDGPSPLVHLGVALGDIVDAGLTWCVSDGNAAASFTRFSRELATLGDFVDFDLLRQREWFNTDNDKDRKGRRSAELLAHPTLPIELVSRVCCHNPSTLQVVRTAFSSVGGVREYEVDAHMYY